MEDFYNNWAKRVSYAEWMKQSESKLSLSISLQGEKGKKSYVLSKLWRTSFKQIQAEQLLYLRKQRSLRSPKSDHNRDLHTFQHMWINLFLHYSRMTGGILSLWHTLARYEQSMNHLHDKTFIGLHIFYQSKIHYVYHVIMIIMWTWNVWHSCLSSDRDPFSVDLFFPYVL